MAERPGESVAAVLRDLEQFDEFVDDVHSIGVRWASREADVVVAEPREPQTPSVFLEPAVEQWLADGGPEPTLRSVGFGFTRERWDPETVSVTHQQHLAMVSGAATTQGDLDEVRIATIATRRALGDAALAPVLAAIDARGGQVLDASPISGTIRAVVDAETVSELLALFDDLQSVNFLREPQPTAGWGVTVQGPTINGIGRRDLLQVDSFHADGYRADPDETIVVTEDTADKVRNQARAFRDTGPTSTTRMKVCIDDADTNEPCSWDSLSNVAGSTGHAHRAACILGCDLEDGQDPDCDGPGSCTTSEQKQRSGVAPEARMVGISTDYRARLLELVTDDPDVYVVFHPYADQIDTDDDCTGETDWSKDWNTLFESGVAVIQANGNLGHTDPTECTLPNPASALGALTVQAYEVEATSPYDEVLIAVGSQGGTSTQGRGRTIVGVWAPTDHDHLTGLSSDSYGAGLNGTSGATPTVAGAAALLRQQWIAERSQAIDDPGVLYTLLLLLGNREREDGSYRLSEFGNLTGAGKLRMRQLDGAGLEGNSGSSVHSVCVYDGDATYVDVRQGNPLPASVTYVKGVAWWYHPAHDDGLDHPLIDLHLQRWNGSAWVTEASDVSDDNRKMVIAPDVGGDQYRWRLTGEHIGILHTTSDCGAVGARVHLAQMHESDAGYDGVSGVSRPVLHASELP